MSTKNQQIVQYKGRPYRLMWRGKTKFGERAKLAFMDGSKEFWVEASAIGAPTSAASSPIRRRGSSRCRECGGPIEDAPHHRAMGGLCGVCAFDEYDM